MIMYSHVVDRRGEWINGKRGSAGQLILLMSISRRNVMPLKHSTSKQAFSHNIGVEIRAGRPQKEAIAIAFAVKRSAAAKKAAATRRRRGR